MTRRQLLRGVAASVAAPLFARFTRPLGVQLYTVRNLLPTKGDATLRAIAAIGYRYTEVEATLPDAKKFAAVLKETGLRPTGSHLDGTTASLASHKLEESIGQAKELGIPAIGLAYVPPAERANPAVFWPKFADELNAAGEQCKKAGLTFYYHHHNFEFDPRTHAIELLHKRLGRDVKLEIDCFWASVGGIDPAAMIQNWSGRIYALHLKDKANGTPVCYETDLVKPADFLEVGAGVIDWTKVLRNAASAGVQHYYVEQDYTAGDPIASLRKSYAFLRA